MDSDRPNGAPASRLFALRSTRHSGRAIFALQDIPAQSVIYRAADLTLNVILREYRREVCGQCFTYQYGHDLAVRDALVGFSFCSDDCGQAWRKGNGDIGVQAWRGVEGLVKGRRRDDDEMVDAAAPRPSVKEIEIAWVAVAEQAEHIRSARMARIDAESEAPSAGVKNVKQLRKALRRALLAPVSADVLTFCTSGILWRYNNPLTWPHITALATDSTPYHSKEDLLAFTRTYLHLLALLPLSLLSITTPETLRMLSSRDSHNSFGIRSLEDDGSEFFGYGCWPSASYFNHSCGPNVEKRREGRTWTFTAGRHIKAGEELCITYLSGEERKMSRGNRWALLKRNWGFECACDRCEI